MKPFDYNKYLKNNPLLKEGIDEATYPLSQRSELIAIKKLMSVISQYGFKQVATPKSPYPKQELFFAGFQNQEGDKIHLGISKGSRAPFASLTFAGSDRPYGSADEAPIIYDKTYWKELLSLKKNSKNSKNQDIEDELEDLDIEIYRTEEELNALDDEGEDTTELEKELMSLEALKVKLIKKLEKSKRSI